MADSAAHGEARERRSRETIASDGKGGSIARDADEIDHRAITGAEAETLQAHHTENDPTTAAAMIANTQLLPGEFKLGTKVVHSSKGLGVIVLLQEDFPPKVFLQFPCTCAVKCDGKEHMHGYKATSWHKLSVQAGPGWSRLASLVQGGQVKAVRKLVPSYCPKPPF